MVGGKLRSLAIGIAFIFVCWAVSGSLVRQLHLPLPGAVLGLVMLFLAFAIFPKLYGFVAPAGTLLLQNFPLFLYPIGAGFLALSGVGFFSVIKILVAILISLTLSLTLCACVFRVLKHRGN